MFHVIGACKGTAFSENCEFCIGGKGFNRGKNQGLVKLQLHDAIYRLRFYSNSLIHILSLSNSHNNIASIQKNWGDKSHRVIGALERYHFVVSTLVLGLQINFDQPIKWMDFNSCRR